MDDFRLLFVADFFLVDCNFDFDFVVCPFVPAGIDSFALATLPAAINDDPGSTTLDCIIACFRCENRGGGDDGTISASAAGRILFPRLWHRKGLL